MTTKQLIGALTAIAATGLFLTLLTSGLLMSSQTVPSSGVVSTVNIGVYLDSACTQICASIDWGTLTAGSTTTRTVYIKNTGTLPITLNMTTTSWNPSNANGPIMLTWNKEGAPLGVNQSTEATMTLAVSPSIGSSITTFSFNIIITGMG